MSEFESIIYEVADGRARITLNRPDKLNALSLQLQAELSEALWEADNDREVHCVIIKGAGRAFSADALAMLFNEQDLLGSKYATKQEVYETYQVAARGDVWPLVTEIRPITEAEAVHDLVEKGAVTGRAALTVNF